jgi:hypothetical protein
LPGLGQRTASPAKFFKNPFGLLFFQANTGVGNQNGQLMFIGLGLDFDPPFIRVFDRIAQHMEQDLA